VFVSVEPAELAYEDTAIVIKSDADGFPVSASTRPALMAIWAGETQTVSYLNRLSDLLFVMARYANYVAGAADIIWAPRS
jgi:hypothetical protein